MLAINASAFDTIKCDALALCSDAAPALDALSTQLRDWQSEPAWQHEALQAADRWRDTVLDLTAPRATGGADATRLPYDADLIGAVQRSHADSPAHDIVVCAAGTLPAELHKLWRVSAPGGYHVEYGYSCMGYEIAGGLGAKLAHPDREVIVTVGDGSYLMMNSEIASSVMLGLKLIVVVLDNRGFGCIQRLQQACGGASFNNLLADCVPEGGQDVHVDFAAHAAALGAEAVHVPDVAALRHALVRARAATRTQVLVISTSHARTTGDGGAWWEVGIPEVSTRPEVDAAAAAAREARRAQRP